MHPKMLLRMQENGVDEATVARLFPFLDTTSAGDLSAATVRDVALFVAGKRPELPEDCDIASRLPQLFETMAPLDAWGDWEARVLTVVASLWEDGRVGVLNWLRDQLKTEPSAALLERWLGALRERELLKSDDEVLAVVLTDLGWPLTDAGEATTTGRWLLERVDADWERVVRVARERGALARLLALVTRERPQLFAAQRQAFEPDAPADQSLLIELLLDMDAAAHEAEAVARAERLTGPYQQLLTAKNLLRFFGDRHLGTVERLLVSAQRALQADDPHNLRLPIVELALAHLGERAEGVLDAYREEYEPSRLEFYAAVLKAQGAKAVPRVVQGLLLRKDPKRASGGMTHAAYVQQLLTLLKQYDLSPHEATLRRALAGKGKKLEELLERTLTAGAAPAPASARLDPAEGYRMEEYADAVVAAALRALAGRAAELGPVQKVKLVGMDGDVQVGWVLVEAGGTFHELELDRPETRIPEHGGAGEDGPLGRYRALHGGAGAPRWGDAYALPQAVLIRELLLAAERLGEALRSAGFTLDLGCTFVTGDGDNAWEGAEDFERRIRQQLAALTEAQQADLAALCYATEARRRWLLG